MILGFKKRFVILIHTGSKKHTIREDKHNRWEAGKKIHFATGVRTKNYKCFKEDTCKSIQKIEIKWRRSFNNKRRLVVIYIDDKLFSEQLEIGYSNFRKLETLSTNDGFNSIKDFLNWFDYNFIGKIIHWTELSY